MQSDCQNDMALSSGISAFEAKYFADACKLLSPLADQGSAEAQYRMAIMAQNGLGMVKRPDMALRYMRAAAESSHPLAQHGLGFMYLYGECVEPSGCDAVKWFERAAEQGLAGSAAALGMMYQDGVGVERDPEEARRWLARAHSEEDHPAG